MTERQNDRQRDYYNPITHVRRIEHFPGQENFKMLWYPTAFSDF